MRGKMLATVSLTGTSLKLQQGQMVDLIPADFDYLPVKYYARPADGKWSDGIDHNPDDSIGLWSSDVEIFLILN